MIRSIKFFSLLLCLMCFACGSGKVELEALNFPAYDKVVNEFFKTYTLENFEPAQIMRFEKRPTGWQVVVIDHKDDKNKIKEELFWSADEEKYLSVDFDKIDNKELQERYINQYLNDYNARNFKIYPYFGYESWDNDVIELLENHDNLEDSMLNALARSYSAHAMNFLNNNFGWASEEVTWDLPMTENSLSAEQLEEYREYTNLAIKTYERLENQNPDFPLIVGSVNTKKSNEHLTAFLNLRMYQNETEALKEIEEDIYSDVLIGYAKNMLQSCPKNTILFTAADNDTYPLLYVQAKLGFRTDVLVINLSQLNTERYVASVRRKIPNAKSSPAPFSLSIEDITGDDRGFLYQTHEMGLPQIELSTVVANAFSDRNKQIFGDQSYYYLPTDQFKISVDSTLIEFQLAGSYIFRGDLMVLDIIAANNMERPICFSSGCGPNQVVGLNNYLVVKGLVLELQTEKHDLVYNYDYPIDTEFLADQLMGEFDFSGIKDMLYQDQRIANNYNAKFHQLADAYLDEDRNEEAAAVLEYRSKVMSANERYFSGVRTFLVGDYYRLGNTDAAEKMAEKIRADLPNLLDPNTKQLMSEEEIEKALAHLENIEKQYK